jgi:phenylalanine-4-hydroxylase
MAHDHTTVSLRERATVVQDWDAYTAAEHEVWRILYGRRVQELQSTGSERVLRGLELVGLQPDTVPDLLEVSRRLEPLTRWRAIPVSGFLPAGTFFESLATRRFPTTVTVRPRQQLDYLPEPDIFHDVFGHVPLHADPVFADALQRCGQLGAAAREGEERTALTRLFWFTIEFGLVRERGEPRIFGSGLVSSSKDAANALGGGCERRPFSLDAVLEQPFAIDDLQPVLFVLESFDQLLEAFDDAARRLGLAPPGGGRSISRQSVAAPT